MKGVIVHDWYGTTLKKPLCWELNLGEAEGVYSVQVPFVPRTRSVDVSGKFVEGLWEQDVVELFLAGDSGRYVEFNVSSQGAWWFMPFSDYRVRAETRCERPRVSVAIEPARREWRVELVFGLEKILAYLGRITAWHVAAIHYAPTSVTYISSRNTEGGDPDFHHFSSFTTR